ncbi:DNA replication licensing factor MCM4 [Monocercomonoides exilis]|uniref:DNA replication licensing factor MCM4 n=1 Tax=Monocercomonoides exilis TaxID=2049356 RepID=UPI00355A7E3B|nr:DNA replication licensing factor MCM4 [Monocercomonoides exilis]|eukprot:MONOS_14882.1-p1 / transcript=MONOS_14882.1 / gene=MONOS_14882 / organism=Monocercomonoides_exilis_PA203 / gene_product=DNA replication licensing factor MCM4 / transcript_product=DNA replication licensing factor MCM4 / location=Mono_scaffold01096:484-4185(+) / protein_length=1014 / sequence_SO=supercontig / SO=protein_coding / is_pseudo=false
MEFQGETVDQFAVRSRTSYEIFFTTFCLGVEMPHYMQLLDDAINTLSDIVPVNLNHVYQFDKDLYRQTLRYPDEMLPIMNTVIIGIGTTKYTDPEINRRIQQNLRVRIFGLRDIDQKKMRDLQPQDISQLVQIDGLVIHLSGVVPDLKSAFFKCSNCGHEEIVKEIANRIAEPRNCDHCHRAGTYVLIHNRSLFIDRQIARVQEDITQIPEGEIPHSVSFTFPSDLINCCSPGDRVSVTGIYRTQLPRVNARVRAARTVFATFIEAVNVQRLAPTGLTTRTMAQSAGGRSGSGASGAVGVSGGAGGGWSGTQSGESDMTLEQREQRKRELIKLGQDPRIYDRLVKSLAPSIFGLEEVKRGLLCQLFGGANYPREDNIPDSDTLNTLAVMQAEAQAQRAAGKRGKKGLGTAAPDSASGFLNSFSHSSNGVASDPSSSSLPLSMSTPQSTLDSTAVFGSIPSSSVQMDSSIIDTAAGQSQIGSIGSTSSAYDLGSSASSSSSLMGTSASSSSSSSSSIGVNSEEADGNARGHSKSSGYHQGGRIGVSPLSPESRSELNILLIGDPSTAKSQLLRYVHRLAPRGMLTSGSGSSAVGLTAYVGRDPDTGELILESGALVMSDGGVCCVDEFDKMGQQARTILHEAMEQQSVTVAKAGIVTTLRARTAVLAAANPRFSRYNPRMTVIANIALPPPLLSRFDMIYLLLDTPDEMKDKLFSRHLLSLFQEAPASDGSQMKLHTLQGGSRKQADEIITDKEKSMEADSIIDEENEQDKKGKGKKGKGKGGEQFSKDADDSNKSEAQQNKKRVQHIDSDLIDPATLTEYIAFARNYCFPQITPEASIEAEDGFVEMRLLGAGQNVVSATVRQLESLLRVATAFARMRLSPVVTKEDVQEALRLVQSALQRAATDPTTGVVDVNKLVTGVSSQAKEMIVKKVKEALLQFHADVIEFKNLLLLVNQHSEQASSSFLSPQQIPISENELLDALHFLSSKGAIGFIGGDGGERRIKKIEKVLETVL